MNWDDLKIVAAVRDDGSFAAAGRALRLDETTVARRVARIERAVGRPLFELIDGARRPTPLCDRLAPMIADMRRTVEAASAVIRDGAALTSFRIAATAALAEAALAPTSPQFIAQNPDIALSILTSDANVNFARWEADFALRLGQPETGDFIIRKLGAVRLFLVQPANGVAPDFLCDYPEPLAHTPEAQAMREVAAAPRRMVTTAPALIRAHLATGRASGVLSSLYLGDLAARPDLEVTELAARRDVWLLIQPHLKDSAPARRVVDWLAAAVASALATSEPDAP